MASAMKWAYLLRLVRYPRPCPRFSKNGKPSTCGFVFAVFAVVEGSRPNVVDGPISWQAGHAAGPRNGKMIRFLPSPGDQRLLPIRCHFKTMPDYGAEARTLIHTRYF